MEKTNTILDRKPLSSEYINSKQDFNKVVKGYQALKTPVWKNAWFYGTVGLASITIAVLATTFTSIDNEDLKTPTTVITATTQQVDKEPQKKSEIILATSDKIVQDNEEPQEIDVIPVADPISEKQQNTVEKPEPTPVVVELIEEEELEKTVSSQSKMPNIAGVSEGPISFSELCDPGGLQVNDNIVVTSYTLQYSSCSGDRTIRMRGNKLPAIACQELTNCGKRVNLYISNIYGFNKKSQTGISLGSIELLTVK